MAKLIKGAIATSIVATAMFATSAHAISNEGECTIEGGTMVNVKGSDFCLVPIRPEAYADPIYDGNQLGVTDCPGDKLNDGLYCMYPVTIRAEAEEVSIPADSSLTDAIVDEGVEAATDVVEDKVNDIVE